MGRAWGQVERECSSVCSPLNAVCTVVGSVVPYGGREGGREGGGGVIRLQKEEVN